MHGVRPTPPRHLQNEIAPQITLRRRRRPEPIRFIRMQHMQCPPVSVRVDRYSGHPHLPARANHPQSDLAAIRNQHFFYRSSQAAILPQGQSLATKSALQRKRPPIAGGLRSCEQRSYCILTPPCVAFSFFSSFALRAPMAFWIQSSTWAISALRAASSPHSRSALRRYVSCRYCIASS